MAWFSIYCTRGGCGKKGKSLGYFGSKEEAQKRLVHHLTTSSYHNMSEEAANKDAEVAEISEWQGEEDTSAHGDRDRQKSREDRSDRSDRSERSDRRETPYSRSSSSRGESLEHMVQRTVQAAVKQSLHAQPAPPSPKVSTDILPYKSSSAAQHVAVSPDMLTSWGRAVASIAKAEQSLRTAARISRSAAMAFEEEAVNLSIHLDTLAQMGITPSNE